MDRVERVNRNSELSTFMSVNSTSLFLAETCYQYMHQLPTQSDTEHVNKTAEQIGFHNCMYIFKQHWLITSRSMQSRHMGLYQSSKYPYI